jgi:hypothetical protein
VPSRERAARALRAHGVVGAFAVAAAVGGAVAGAHPTGTVVVDRVETALFAALFTLLVARCGQGLQLLVGVVVVLLARQWLLVPAVLCALLVFSSIAWRRVPRATSAAVGALAVQVILRWPPRVFFGFPSAVAAALVVLCGVSVWRALGPRGRRRVGWCLAGGGGFAVLAAVPLVVGILLVRTDVASGEQAAKAAIAGIGDGKASAVRSDLRVASADTAHASGIVGSWLCGPARLVPVLAQQGRIVAGTLAASRDATRVGLADAPLVDYHQLKYRDGQVNLAKLSALAAPMRAIDQQLHALARGLRADRTEWLVGPIQHRTASLSVDVQRATHSADLAEQSALDLPGLLGGDGVRRYFVAFMSPSESRGYDGFVGSYGILTADNGHVSLTQSGVTSDLETLLPPGGATLRGLQGYLARYGQFHPGKFIRDATYSPDFPTVARVLSEEYAQTGGGEVDGVLAIDPYGLAAMLRFTGPVQVPGLPVPLTAANAAQVLLTEQYTTFDAGEDASDEVRHDVLQSALHVVFDRLVAGSLPSPSTVADVLDPAVLQGRISFWTFHQRDQSLIRNLNLEGAFPRVPNGDLVAVTTQNADQNKIDAFLHQRIDTQITYDPGTGSIRSTVTITLQNDAPPSGLPPIVIDTAFPNLAPGTNRTWLAIYSPLGFDRVTLGGVPISMVATPELGVNAYSAFVDVPPLSSVTLVMHLAGNVAPGDHLAVHVRLQPSVNRQDDQVDVAAAPGWRLLDPTARSHWELGQNMQQARTFDFS